MIRRESVDVEKLSRALLMVAEQITREDAARQAAERD
jgi:hypothetical protein